MWTIGYVARMPRLVAPSVAIGVLLIVCLLVGGFVCGRYTLRGWRGGAWVGLLSSLINLLVLASLVSGHEPNTIRPSALWWLPGSLLAGVVLGALGAAVGNLIPSGVQRPNWPAGLARVTAAATLLLLVAGGIVTSTDSGLAVIDWPNSYGYNMFLYPLAKMTGGIYFEHSHRLLGALVGLTTLVFAVHLQFVEPRRWVRRLALAALALVIAQGVLGGLRVTGRPTLSADPGAMRPNIVFAMIHAVLGQVFFGLLVALNVFLAATWQRPAEPLRRPTAATDHLLTVLLVAAILVQLVFGAVLRHVAGGLTLHIVMAMGVLLLAVLCGARAWAWHRERPPLNRLGPTMVFLTIWQVVLGMLAMTATGVIGMKLLSGPPEVILPTVHQVIGAILLAHAVRMMLWTRLLVRPGQVLPEAPPIPDGAVHDAA